MTSTTGSAGIIEVAGEASRARAAARPADAAGALVAPMADAPVMEHAKEEAATVAVRSPARLGMLVGKSRLLVDLAEAGEILPMPPSIVPVPLTRAWFLGMTNVRGSLHTVIDLRRFLGRGVTEVGKESRLLSLAPSLGFNVTLVVGRMLGLRTTASMTPVAPSDDPSAPASVAWLGDAFADADGDIWRELSLSKLVAEPAFLMVGR